VELNKRVSILILIAQVIILSCAYYFIRLDDAYIFYKYAKNLAEGNGYTFNLDERVNATTSIMYPLLLSLIYFSLRIKPEILFPLAGTLLSILSLGLSGILLSKIFKKDFQKFSVILPLIVLAMPQIKNAIGMETFLKVFFIVLSLYLFQNKKYELLSFVCAILLLTRPDAAIFIFVLIAFYIIEEKKFLSLRQIMIFILTIILFYVFIYINTDSLVPTSFFAKIFQGRNKIIAGEFIEGFVLNFPGGRKFALMFYLIIILSLMFLLKFRSPIFKNKPFQILLVYSLFQISVYSFILKPPPYPWYYAEYIVVYSIILVETYRVVSEKFLKRIDGAILIFIMIIFFSLGVILPIKTIKNGYGEKFLLYKNVASNINQYSNQSIKLAADEVGILGFYFKGKMIDELGLIHRNFDYDNLEKDFGLTVKKNNPDYVIIDFPDFPKYKSYITQKWFKEKYEEFYTLKYFYSGVKVFRLIKSD